MPRRLPPHPAATATAAPTPAGSATTLPIDSSLAFVLDDPLSSVSAHAGQVVHLHLAQPIVLGGRVVVPAGTPAVLHVLNAAKAGMADAYGFIDIFFLPLALPNGESLPLRAPAERLTMHVSAGHASTVGIEDTIGDIFIPDYALYQVFRHGKNFVLGKGAVIHARTDATLALAPTGTVAVVTPPPIVTDLETPKAAFPVEPVATPFGPAAGPYPHTPRPLASPSPSPSAAPTSAASPSASPANAAAPLASPASAASPPASPAAAASPSASPTSAASPSASPTSAASPSASPSPAST